MKFDDLLALYLYENKKLQLQEIGTFELDNTVTVPPPSDKETYYPIEGLQYKYSTKVTTTDDLISFLVKKLGKIQPLVSSDLDSYLSNVRQFINIGKPYTIEGIGTLQSNNQGTYEFIPGHFINVSYSKEETTPRRERTSHERPATDNGNIIRRPLIAVISIVVLAAIAWAIYTYLYKPGQGSAQADNSVVVPEKDSVSDTASTFQPTIDSSASFAGSSGYKMIFEITSSRQRAETRTAYLKKLTMPATYDSVVTANSRYYRLFMPFNVPSSDTLRIRDSLYRIFAKKITIAKL